MSKKNVGDKVDQLVESKFKADGYTVVDRKNDSPNARHYILQKGSLTKHLKVIKKTYIDGNEFSEIDLLNNITSDHVVELESHGDVDEKNVYLLFPHINGTTLDKMRKADGWSEEELTKLINEVTKGLMDIAKAGIVHQDIKPGNIIYDNVNKKYVILDLGIGFFIEGPNKSNTAIPKGKGPKFYSAPEQFKIAIREPYSLYQTIDQFSFGAVLYELATSAHPYIEFSDTEAQSYATLVMDESLPKRITREGKLSEKMCSTIEKMLSKDPSQRHLSLQTIVDRVSTSTVTEKELSTSLYLKMPSKGKDDFTKIVQEHSDIIGGVILNPSDSVECAKSLDDLNIPIILDPKTYNLQVNESTEQLSKKLGIPYSASFSILTLYKLKDQLLEGVHNLATKMYSSVVVLPYFNVEGAGTEYLDFTKEIWLDAKQHYKEKGLDDSRIYGGIIIPYNVTTSKKERTKLLSQLIGSYPLDGLILTFENVDKSIATSVEQEYLKGVKEICEFFNATFKNVIIYQTDISVLPFAGSSSYATGWSKGSRHFNFNKVGGNGKNRPPYKMKLFAEDLFTFIEEKSKIQIISLMGKAAYLKCSCVDCTANDPISPSYKENESHEKRHFYRGIADIYSRFSDMKLSDRNKFIKTYLEKCDANGTDVKSSGAIGNETVPSYKGLISLIDS